MAALTRTDPLESLTLAQWRPPGGPQSARRGNTLALSHCDEACVEPRRRDGLLWPGLSPGVFCLIRCGVVELWC